MEFGTQCKVCNVFRNIGLYFDSNIHFETYTQRRILSELSYSYARWRGPELRFEGETALIFIHDLSLALLVLVALASYATRGSELRLILSVKVWMCLTPFTFIKTRLMYTLSRLIAGSSLESTCMLYFVITCCLIVSTLVAIWIATFATVVYLMLLKCPTFDESKVPFSFWFNDSCITAVIPKLVKMDEISVSLVWFSINLFSVCWKNWAFEWHGLLF